MQRCNYFIMYTDVCFGSFPTPVNNSEDSYIESVNRLINCLKACQMYGARARKQDGMCTSSTFL